MALSRPRYARCAKASSGEAEGAGGASGHRHGHRSRSLLGSFGTHRFRVDQPLFSRALVTGDASQAQAAREQAAAALAQAQNIPIEQAREQVAQYEQQHRQAVEQAKQKAAAAADTATKAATRAALFSVLALVLGALAGWFGGGPERSIQP